MALRSKSEEARSRGWLVSWCRWLSWLASTHEVFFAGKVAYIVSVLLNG